MKKWQIENSEKLEKSEISEKLFRVFLCPSFRFCPTAKIQNSDLKISEKNFRGFRVFDLTPFFGVFPQNVSNKSMWVFRFAKISE